MTHVLSPAGIALIQMHEGFHAEAAPLGDGRFVIGHGHICTDAAKAITRPQAADLLEQDAAAMANVVDAALTRPLTQPQFDALVSFAFSIGATAFLRSQVLRRVNAGDFVAAACGMDAWRRVETDGQLEVNPALVRRRAAEKALFLSDLPHDGVASALLRPQLDYAADMLGVPARRQEATRAPVAAIAAAQSDGEKITRILRSEPATETLLLTEPAPPACEDEDELVTAHAKPVARQVEAAADPLQPRIAKKRAKPAPSLLAKPQNKLDFDWSEARETIALVTLLVFGLSLIGLSASFLFDGEADLVSIVGAGALAVPGIAASALAGFGLWRGATENYAQVA